jgi:hypothetical protein
MHRDPEREPAWRCVDQPCWCPAGLTNS